jgi:hypothetical protein
LLICGGLVLAVRWDKARQRRSWEDAAPYEDDDQEGFQPKHEETVRPRPRIALVVPLVETAVILAAVARTELSDEMTILIGEDIAPKFQRAKRELVLATVGAAPGEYERSRDRAFSGVGSSNEPLVEVRGLEPLSSSDHLGLLRA